MDEIFDIKHLETFEQITKEVLCNLFVTLHTFNDDVIKPSSLTKAKKELEQLIVKCNYDISKVAKFIKGNYDNEDKVKCFLSVLENRKSELLYEILLHHNSKYGENVTDFDWVLKLVLGTSDLKTFKYPLLQLVLLTENYNGQQKSRVYDITKEMLSKIISELESLEIK